MPEETRQECLTCGRISRPGLITICNWQKYAGSSTTIGLGSACDWRWVTVYR